MAYLLSVFKVDDFDTFKQMFDSDPAGRAGAAKGHRLFRGVDDPNLVFVGTEFDSVDGAKALKERLISSGVVEQMDVQQEPTVAELVEEQRY
jgi:hypothetical protein